MICSCQKNISMGQMVMGSSQHSHGWAELRVRSRCNTYMLWKVLPLSSGTSRLCSSQPLIIFPLPVVMRSLFTPWIPLCICQLPLFFLSHCFFFFFLYYETEEAIIGERDEERGWKCKYRLFLLTYQSSLHAPLLCSWVKDLHCLSSLLYGKLSWALRLVIL